MQTFHLFSVGSSAFLGEYLACFSLPGALLGTVKPTNCSALCCFLHP